MAFAELIVLLCMPLLLYLWRQKHAGSFWSAVQTVAGAIIGFSLGMVITFAVDMMALNSEGIAFVQGTRIVNPTIPTWAIVWNSLPAMVSQGSFPLLGAIIGLLLAKRFRNSDKKPVQADISS